MPTQLVAVLADPLLQKLMLLRPDAEGFARVSSWVMACVGDVASGDVDLDALLDMLDIIHDFVQCTKVRENAKPRHLRVSSSRQI